MLRIFTIKSSSATGTGAQFTSKCSPSGANITRPPHKPHAEALPRCLCALLFLISRQFEANAWYDSPFVSCWHDQVVISDSHYVVHHPASVPWSAHLSVFGVTSISPVCVYNCIYLFCCEGCKHIWYWFGAVRYDSNGLNLSIVQNITCHDTGAPSSLARQMYYCSAGVVTRLAFVLLLLSLFFSHFVFPPSHQSHLLSCFIEIEVLITAQANLELTEWSASQNPQQTQ